MALNVLITGIRVRGFKTCQDVHLPCSDGAFLGVQPVAVGFCCGRNTGRKTSGLHLQACGGSMDHKICGFSFSGPPRLPVGLLLPSLHRLVRIDDSHELFLADSGS